MNVKFDVISTIGEGGQGKVELCRDKETKQFFARKIIRCTTIDQLNTALQECLVLLQVNHPHIVATRTFYLDEPRGGGYEINILYEFCNKSTLRGFINRFREKNEVIKFPQILQWIEQLCSAIAHIHKKKIIHRDLKPDNVMLSGSSFSVKLGDFGFSKRLDESKEFAKSMLGTYFFTSPEIRRQDPYTKAVDIWGIYVILLDLLLPKTFDFSFELLANPKKIYNQITSRYDQDVSNFVKKLVKIEPQDRPSAEELLNTIRDYRRENLGQSVGHEELEALMEDLQAKEREIFLLKKELEHVSTSITFSTRELASPLGVPGPGSPTSAGPLGGSSVSSGGFPSPITVVGEASDEMLTVTPPPLFTPMTAKVFQDSEFRRSEVFKSFSERGNMNVITVRDKEISKKIPQSPEIKGQFYSITFHRWNRKNNTSEVVALKRPTDRLLPANNIGKSYKKMSIEKFVEIVRYKLVSKFDHPNIERVIGVVNLKKEGYRLVSEGLLNGTLQSYILNHNYDIHLFQKIQFAFDIASAILCFLSHGYVHTRLCTTLIMMAEDNRNCKVVSTYFCVRNLKEEDDEEEEQEDEEKLDTNSKSRRLRGKKKKKKKNIGTGPKSDAKKHIFSPFAQILWEIFFRRKFDGDYSNIQKKDDDDDDGQKQSQNNQQQQQQQQQKQKQQKGKKNNKVVGKGKKLEEMYFEIIRFCLERESDDFEMIHRVVYKLSKMKEVKWEAVKRKAMTDSNQIM